MYLEAGARGRTARYFSCRTALEWLRGGAGSPAVVVISLSPDGALAEDAEALGCRVTHLGLEASASLAPAALQALAAQRVEASGGAAVLVGHVMKASREATLVAQGLLPLGPEGGLCFAPLDLGRPLAAQPRPALLLHKLTDFLVPGDGSGAAPGYSAQAAALQAWLAAPPPGGGAGVCVTDPLPSLGAVMDRVAMAGVMDAAAAAVRRHAIPMRSPAWAELPGSGGGGLARQLAAAGVQLPCIVKPRVACGVAEAHAMAFVLHASGLAELESLPLPAVAQEYVDHGGVVWKVYVAGEQVGLGLRRNRQPSSNCPCPAAHLLTHCLLCSRPGLLHA